MSWERKEIRQANQPTRAGELFLPSLDIFRALLAHVVRRGWPNSCRMSLLRGQQLLVHARRGLCSFSRPFLSGCCLSVLLFPRPRRTQGVLAACVTRQALFVFGNGYTADAAWVRLIPTNLILILDSCGGYRQLSSWFNHRQFSLYSASAACCVLLLLRWKRRAELPENSSTSPPTSRPVVGHA